MFKSIFAAFKAAPPKIVPVTPELIQKRKNLCTKLGSVYEAQLAVLTESLPEPTVHNTPLIGYYSNLASSYKNHLNELEDGNNSSLQYSEEDFLKVITKQLDGKVSELEQINAHIKQQDLKSLDVNYNDQIDTFFYNFHMNRIRASYALKEYIYPTPLLQRHNTLQLINDGIKMTSQSLSLNDYPVPAFTIDNSNTNIDVYCVSPHIVHILFELFKNSTIPSIIQGKPISLKVIDNESDCIYIEVKDEGGGMPSNVIEKIWQFHYTTSNADDRDPIHGFGMGLPLCKVFADFNNGHLELQNKEGEGVTVLIKLPRWKKD